MADDTRGSKFNGEELIKQDLITREDLDKAHEREAATGTPWYRQLLKARKTRRVSRPWKESCFTNSIRGPYVKSMNGWGRRLSASGRSGKRTSTERWRNRIAAAGYWETSCSI